MVRRKPNCSKVLSAPNLFSHFAKRHNSSEGGVSDAPGTLDSPILQQLPNAETEQH